MKRIVLILSLILTFSFFTETELTASPGKDFQITRTWVSMRSGDINVRVKYRGPKPFRGNVYFGIWFNGAMKRPVRKQLTFTNNDMFEFVLCNYSHLGTTSGEGKLKVKVDVTSQYRESREDNNVYERKITFAEISNIELKVTPFKCYLKKGEIEKFTFTAKVTFRGRGIVFCEYFKHYSRSRIRGGQMGYTLLSSNKTGPSTFYCKLGTDGYGTKTKTFSWNKIESYDIRTKDGEKHKRSFVIRALSPNRVDSNKAIWIVIYKK